MRGSALAISPASATKWTVINGPMKGSVRLMNAPQFVVGRSPECEFVIINDPKCSRRHAQIVSTGYGAEVTSLNDKNPVLVNGQAVERASLNDGDVVTFGVTEVQFHLTSVSSGSQLAVVVDPGPGPGLPASHGPVPIAPAVNFQPPGPRAGRKPRKKPQGKGRLLIYGVLGLIVLAILLPTKGQKAKTREEQVQAEVEAFKKVQDAADAAVIKRGNQTVIARQAQENYLRGFRDYKKGQFERALTSFQACLALSPEHVLCNRYMRLTQKKFDEMIQYQMILGKRYRGENQYRSCRATFRNVLFMVKDASSPVFQEAKSNYEACDALAEGAY